MVICMQYQTIMICGCGLFGCIGSNFLPMALNKVLLNTNSACARKGRRQQHRVLVTIYYMVPKPGREVSNA